MRSGHAPYDSVITALNRVSRELRRQTGVRGVGFGDDKQAARILVDTVHDAGALHAADTGQAVAAMGQQRVD